MSVNLQSPLSGPAKPPGKAARLARAWGNSLYATLLEMRRRWYVHGPVFAIWIFALWRVLGDPTPHFPILFNWTASLPYTVALVQERPAELHRGDFVVYAFEGDARKLYPGLYRQPFFKRIAGLPGDRVTVLDRYVFVNGVNVGRAKFQTVDHKPLQPIAPRVIPAGYYYVQGVGADSFDSRYELSGLVASRQILSKVRPLF